MTLYRSGGKRIFDVAASLAGLIVLSPVIALLVVIASLDTGAFGLYRQVRIGRGGAPFVLNKVRTMVPNDGGHITTGSDSRVTPVGSRLRRLKLDELPQLWNVLVGDMSLVGPRPEVPDYASRILDACPALASLRPGVTGPATLCYRDEEALLESSANPVRYNDEVILPHKIRINDRYRSQYSFASDLLLILRSVNLHREGTSADLPLQPDDTRVESGDRR